MWENFEISHYKLQLDNGIGGKTYKTNLSVSCFLHDWLSVDLIKLALLQEVGIFVSYMSQWITYFSLFYHFMCVSHISLNSTVWHKRRHISMGTYYKSIYMYNRTSVLRSWSLLGVTSLLRQDNLVTFLTKCSFCGRLYFKKFWDS